jgi:hypothetical protein
MSKIVQFTEEQILARLEAERKSHDYEARMERLANMRDEDIDLSDIPEPTDEELARATRPGWGGLRPGTGRKPSGNRSVHIRLRPAIIRRLHAAAKRRRVTLSQIVEEQLASV